MKRPGKLEPVLKRPVWQNGCEIQIKGCSTATIERLDNLKPGFYLDGLIEVRITGRDGNEKTEILYPCARRMRMSYRARVFLQRHDQEDRSRAERRSGRAAR